MKKLSVIIVSYNNIQVLKNCLDSIKKFNDIGDLLEVIVSDNSLTYDLYNAIIEEYDWVKIIKNENRGFGAGNNVGVNISTGEYLLFLNPDTILVEPVFEFIVNKFENDPNLALCGVQLIQRNNKKNCSFFYYDNYSIFSILLEKCRHKFSLFDDKKMFICGADIFIRRQSFLEAGCFDEQIFMYKEEADLTKRIKLYSVAQKIAFYKEKKIIHLEGGTEEGNDFNKQLKVAERLVTSDRYYAQKWKLDYKKIIKSRIRYNKFKRIIHLCLLKKKKAKNEKILIEYFKSQLS